MRVVFILLVSLFMFSQNSQAMLIPTERIGTAYNDGFWYEATSQYIGPANRGGTALGFSISEGYNISVFRGIVTGLGDSGDFGNVEMSLYKGSTFRHDSTVPVPSGNMIYSGSQFKVPMDGTITHDEFTNLALDPGEYWVAFQGGASFGNMRADGFNLEGEKFGSVNTPEPSTLALFGSGFGFLLSRFRRK